MLQPSQAFVFCDYEILAVACSHKASFCEHDKPDGSSFGQNTHGLKDWLKNLNLYPLTLSTVKEYLCFGTPVCMNKMNNHWFWPVRLHRSPKSKPLLFLISTQSVVNLLFFKLETILLTGERICFLDFTCILETFFMFLLPPYLCWTRLKREKKITDKKIEIFVL